MRFLLRHKDEYEEKGETNEAAFAAASMHQVMHMRTSREWGELRGGRGEKGG